MGAKAWSEEEIEILNQNIGFKTPLKISNMLKKRGFNRSKLAVEQKALRDNMSTQNISMIPFGMIAGAFGEFYVNFKERAVKSGLKIKKVQYEKGKSKRNMVEIKHFWKWAYENKDTLRFDRFNKNELGPEPSWVDEERRKDFNKSRENFNFKSKRKVWEEEEVTLLIQLLQLNKYDIIQLSMKLNRNQMSILSKINRLDTKYRPVKSIKSGQPWGHEEIEIFIKMLNEGKSYDEISICIGRTVESLLRYYNERLKGDDV